MIFLQQTLESVLSNKEYDFYYLIENHSLIQETKYFRIAALKTPETKRGQILFI